MSVYVAGRLSKEVKISLMFPQRSVLGPMPFFISVIFITSTVLRSWAAFADDFKLSVCYSKKNLDDIEEGVRKIQLDLNHVAETSRCWNPKMSPAKIKV